MEDDLSEPILDDPDEGIEVDIVTATKSSNTNTSCVSRDSLEVMRNVCRGLLFFCNTTGCRRRPILKYFNDPSINKPIGDPRCCDNCMAQFNAPPNPPLSLMSLFPEQIVQTVEQ